MHELQKTLALALACSEITGTTRRFGHRKCIKTNAILSRFSSAPRWFCEGRELHNSPDIQIWRDGDLHTLVISEAFEDDTGRYNCVASNSLGADNTSAEVYIEGQPLSRQQVTSYPNVGREGTFRRKCP